MNRPISRWAWGASMVGVHRLRALLVSHHASALSHIQSWVHWPQAPETFLIAGLIAWISLLYGFHHKGRPFGSRKATAHTIAIIAVTALVAGVLSIFVPHLPLSIGIFVPALLCRAVLKEGEEEQELRAANPELAAIITLGISYMLNRLREQMAGDCADWCERQTNQLRSWSQPRVEDKPASLNNFASAAYELRSMLLRRLPDDDLKVQVRDHYAVVDPAVSAAENYRNLQDEMRYSEEYNKVEEALYQLLQLAYDWKYTNIDTAFMSKPQQWYNIKHSSGGKREINIPH
jgi:hypothetical protein